MSLTIVDGQDLILDPNDIRFVSFDWDADNLPASVTIATSTFTIETEVQKGATALTKDNPSILTLNRKTQVRLNAQTATDGDRYVLSNQIVTNESPSQTKERSVRILVMER